ncbi:MAG: sigma-70 family RNA polymerase sigma factor [Planctomycetota bacterium]
MDPSLSEIERRVADGDSAALAEAFELHRDRLKRMIAIRMNPRLNQRLSESDIMQEAFVDAQTRVNEWKPKKMPLFLWLRLLTGQKLVELNRFHVVTQKRSANREVSIHNRMSPDASVASMAGLLVGKLTTVSQAAVKEEIRELIRKTLSQLRPLDREVLSLRHFEQLTNAEAARELNVAPSTASERYFRALEKLRTILEQYPEVFGSTN